MTLNEHFSSPKIVVGNESGPHLARSREKQPERLRRLFMLCRLLLVMFLTIAAGTEVAEARVFRIEPGEDYRESLRALQPGDELVFLPGIHPGRARLHISGTSEKPITIRGVVEEGRVPELQLTDRHDDLWRIEGRHFIVRDLGFHASQGYAIKFRGVEGAVIEDCVFRACGGGAISANTTGAIDGLRVSSCRFLEMPVTPVYIGSHSGRLDIRNFVFERNVIDGSKIRTSGIGYGIQLKLNVRGGVIRENFIAGTQGPGIMVYGSENARAKDANLIERNIVIGSRTSSGIVVGGGPAIVRSNVVIGCHGGGISLQNYGKRNLLDRITLVDNLAAGNRQHDFSFGRPLTRCVAKGNYSWRTAPGHGFEGLPKSSARAGNRTFVMSDDLRRSIARSEGIVPTSASKAEVWKILGSRHSERTDILALKAILDMKATHR